MYDIYIYTYTSNTASKITIHKVPKPHPTKTHLMIDVWSHFITGCHCFLLQLQLPFSHMPRLSRTHQSGGHHEKTHGRKVTRSTGEPFGNLLEGHRRFLFRYFGGFHSWHLQWTAGLLPNRSSTPHGPKKKGTQLRFFLLGPSLEKKMHFPFWRLPPFLCSTHPFFWEKNPNLPPRKVRKKKQLFSMRPMRRINPIPGGKKILPWRFRILRIRG